MLLPPVMLIRYNIWEKYMAKNSLNKKEKAAAVGKAKEKEKDKQKDKENPKKKKEAQDAHAE